MSVSKPMHQIHFDNRINTKDAEIEIINKPKKQEAYNPETGEINWDCPCLAGALKPPCGEYFKKSFSCFVSSKSEPKGEECVELFAQLTKCFEDHPEDYVFSDSENEE